LTAFLGQAFLTLIVLPLAPFWLVYGFVSLREGKLFDGAKLLSAGRRWPSLDFQSVVAPSLGPGAYWPHRQHKPSRSRRRPPSSGRVRGSASGGAP